MRTPSEATHGLAGQSITGPPGVQDARDSAGLVGEAGGGQVDGLYVHVPFCFRKCHYCDFYSIVDRPERQRAFAERLIDEMTTLGALIGPGVRTVFVGGGTPTLLGPDVWRRVLAELARSFDLSGVVEFTVEANPETVTAELMTVLAAGGVNRISIGAQSFDVRHLKTLERWHEVDNVTRAVDAARAAGIDDVNLDLIFAIPGQLLDDWRADLRRALALEPVHLSCYALTYEPDTPMTVKLRQGLIGRCDEQLEATMYERTIEALAGAGFEHYEISNFARPGRRCEHNLVYWRSGNWLGLGPGAASHVDGLRWKNVPNVGRYLTVRGGAPVQEVERLDADGRFGEQLMMRLRLIDGVELDWLDRQLDARRGAVVEQHIGAGLLKRTDTHLRLTRRGLLLGDSVAAELL